KAPSTTGSWFQDQAVPVARARSTRQQDSRERSPVVSRVSLQSWTTSTRSATTGSCATEKTRFPGAGSGTMVRFRNRTAPPAHHRSRFHALTRNRIGSFHLPKLTFSVPVRSTSYAWASVASSSRIFRQTLLTCRTSEPRAETATYFRE